MKTANALYRICNAIICALWTLLCGLMLWSVFVEEAERPNGSLLFTLLFAAAILLCCICILRLGIKERILLLAVLAAGFAARLLIILLVPAEPTSDFDVLYRCAEELSRGNFAWIANGADSLYFSRWGYQIPFVLYEAAILKLFGSAFAIKLVNLLFTLGTGYLVYKTAECIWSERSAICAALFFAICPELIQMSPVLTNQHISAFFLLLAIYIYIYIMWSTAESDLSCRDFASA